MAVQKEIWVKDIKDKLFAGVEFVKNSQSHDEFVDNLTVHIPQAGALPAVSKNRSVFPGTISQRTDTDNYYSLAEFTTDPILIRDLEAMQISYNKRQSILNHHIRTLNDRLGLEALYNWCGSGLVTASGQIVLTTGTGTTTIAPPGSTSSTKGILLADIATAASKLDEDDVPGENRFLVMPSKAYWNFVEVNKAQLLNLDYNKGLTNGDIANGIVAKVYKFNIITRSYTVVFADAATPTIKAVGAATATSDVWGMVGWQADCVAKALGDVKMYINEDQAAYYGTIISAAVNFGCVKGRSDAKGIVTIVQDV
jgi:hypothetical protein